MNTTSIILALLTGAAGWFYLFYSRAASQLAEFEDQKLNRLRVILRRVGGGVMLALGVGLYLGFRAADEPVEPRRFMAVWSAVIILLGALVALALADVWLTHRLRLQRLRRNRGKPFESSSPRETSPDDRPPAV